MRPGSTARLCFLDKSDDDDLQAVECAVCLDACVDPCTLRGCPSASSHTFCLSCITRVGGGRHVVPAVQAALRRHHPAERRTHRGANQVARDAPRVEADDVVGMDEHGNAVTARGMATSPSTRSCARFAKGAPTKHSRG